MYRRAVTTLPELLHQRWWTARPMTIKLRGHHRPSAGRTASVAAFWSAPDLDAWVVHRRRLTARVVPLPRFP